jgi:hypothetical protein
MKSLVGRFCRFSMLCSVTGQSTGFSVRCEVVDIKYNGLDTTLPYISVLGWTLSF